MRYSGALQYIANVPGMYERTVIAFILFEEICDDRLAAGCAIGPKPVIDAISQPGHPGLTIAAPPTLCSGQVLPLTGDQSYEAQTLKPCANGAISGGQHFKHNQRHSRRQARVNLLPLPQM